MVSRVDPCLTCNSCISCAVLYCTKLAQAQTSEDKARVEEEMLGHAELRHALAVIKGEDDGCMFAEQWRSFVRREGAGLCRDSFRI